MLIMCLQLMNLLFSFLEPNRPHSALLAGYFSKVFFYDTGNLLSYLLLSQNGCLDPLLFWATLGCCMPYDTKDSPTYELCSSK